MGEHEELRPADEASPASPDSAPNLCPDCSGKGEVDGRRCSGCGGSGVIEAGVGGG